MRTHRHWLVLAAAVVLAVAGITIFATRGSWGTRAPSGEDEHAQTAPAAETKTLQISKQARDNLGLMAKPAQLQSYWRTIQVPGEIVDRPGLSDRGVTAPAVSTVVKVHAFPGDTVRAGDRLFTLRLSSEYLQNSQSELFKVSREIQLVREQRDRLVSIADTVAPAKVVELENQLRRLTAALQSYRQDLLARGLRPAQVDGVAEGQFVSEIEVVAPPAPADGKRLVSTQPLDAGGGLAYEVQELKAELGQQVQAGQLLSILANHQSLYIEGHSFKREASLLAQAAQNRWPVQVEFSEDENQGWPPLEQSFHIRHLANTLDPARRTFEFYLPLINQSRHYGQEGRVFLVWRFRPGQRVRLQVPVEKFENVFVLPADAVAREGPEAYVFRQNGDLFDRRPVHVLHADRRNVVLANDGSVAAGMYLAQNAAASLNRVLKAQSASGGLPPGAHFHADGSLHIPGKE
jgi:multidrug efflux pump subunit AcrA (membrane-fusion protein)